MSNAMSLKAKIRNIAKQKNIPAQVIFASNIGYQDYPYAENAG